MAAGARHKSSMCAGTLYYKPNNWVSFAFEQSLCACVGTDSCIAVV